MRRRLLELAGILLLLAVLYEMAFRYCTAQSGEMDVNVRPLRVYYSADMLSTFAWRKMLFGFRARLPFGKVRLAEGTALFVDGGRFYWRMPDGSWYDMTDDMTEYLKRPEKR